MTKNLRIKYDYIKNNYNKVIFLLLFVTLFLIFYSPYIIVDSRLDLNLDPLNTFKSFFYTWNHTLSLGQDYTIMNVYIFPLGIFYFLFSLAFNIHITQALIYIIFLMIGFYSFVKFCENEFNQKSAYIYIGGLYYIFNLYILTNISTAYLNLTLP